MSDADHGDAAAYRHASVVRLTMDDPRNGHEEGSVFIEPGTCDDGVAYTVVSEEKKGFLDIECEVLETFEADTRMSRPDIKSWGAQQAKQAGISE